MNRFIIPDDLRVKIIPLLVPETLKHFQVTFLYTIITVMLLIFGSSFASAKHRIRCAMAYIGNHIALTRFTKVILLALCS